MGAAGFAQHAVSLADVGSASVPVSKSGDTFDLLVQGLEKLNSQMTANQQVIQSVAAGQTDDLHRLVMSLESTKLSFDLALQVRNKILDAYQEMMRMQV